MKRTVLFVIFVVFLAGLGFAQSDLQPAAIINLIRSEPITVKQLRTEVERMEQGAQRPLTADERRQVLDVMINERLAIQAAERDRVAVSENDINQQLQQFKAQLSQSVNRQVTDAEFAQAVRTQTGLDMNAFREQARRQLVVQKYLMSKKQNIFEGLREPTEEEILNVYNLSKSRFVRPETVRFSMIQVAYGNDRVRAKELADRLFREVGSSAAKFDEVALRGQAANSGYQAGDGGYLPRNLEAQQIVGLDFINTAFSLKLEEVSKMMEGAMGFQFIKVTEAYAMKNLELSDIFQLGTRVTVRDYIRQALGQEKEQALLAQATEELVTELRAGGSSFQVFENNISW
ncbi:MAG TPA: hypothetical protein DEQ14_02195 [Treponema sp.]|nr:hypothetical protein [Treponema sp.]